MITTKSGKSGKTRVNYSGNVRFSDAIQIPDMVDSYTFAQYFNRANTNDGGGLVFDEAALERIKNYQTGKYTDPNTPEYYGAKAGNDGKWQNYTGSFANTDWFKEFYKNWVPSTEHNLNISGGTDKLTYMISGSFLDQKGLLRHGEDQFNPLHHERKNFCKVNRLGYFELHQQVDTRRLRPSDLHDRSVLP